MTEILTESFCERCGTRYTFESARPRVRLKGVRVLSRGLKNFVLSDDSSIDEAMAAARSETDRELTTHQLDAFHKTFNFCMTCRQYTCPNCWNEAEARCLTCAPLLGHDVLPAPFPDLVTNSYLLDPVDAFAVNGSNGSNGTIHDAVDGASGQGVDTADFAARLQALMAPPADEPAKAVAEPAEAVVAAAGIDEIVPDVIDDVAVNAADADEAPGDSEPVGEIEIASEAPVAVEAALVLVDVETAEESNAVEVEPVAAVDPASEQSDDAAQIAARLAAWSAAAVVMDAARDADPDSKPNITEKSSAQTGGLLRRFRAGQNLDAELDDYERQRAATSPVADELEPAVVAEAAALAEPEIVFEPEVVAEPEAVALAEPEIAADPEAVTVAEPEIAAEPEAVALAETEIAAEPEAVTVAEPEIAAEPEAVTLAEPEIVFEPEVVAEPEAAASDEPVAAVVLAEAAVAAEVTAEPEVAVETEAAAAVEPEVIAEPAPQIDDVIPQPTWQIVAPDTTELPGGPPPTPAPSIPVAASALDPNAEPQWPSRPEWPGGASPSAGLPFLNRPATPTGGVEALWAASAREVVAPPGAGRPVANAVQPCISCGLSLSATARFCRRCGTPQAL